MGGGRLEGARVNDIKTSTTSTVVTVLVTQCTKLSLLWLIMPVLDLE